MIQIRSCLYYSMVAHTKTSATVYDPKGSCPTETYDVSRIRVYGIHFFV